MCLYTICYFSVYGGWSMSFIMISCVLLELGRFVTSNWKNHSTSHSKCGCHLLHLFWSSTNVDIPKTCYTSSILQPNWWEFTNSKCSKLHEPIKVLSYSIILFWCLSFNNDDWILISISLNSCNGLVKCIMERRTYIMIQLINKWLTENSTTNGAKMKPSTLISWSLWSPCAIPIRFKLDSSSYS